MIAYESPNPFFSCQRELGLGRPALPRGFLSSSALAGISTWESGAPVYSCYQAEFWAVGHIPESRVARGSVSLQRLKNGVENPIWSQHQVPFVFSCCWTVLFQPTLEKLTEFIFLFLLSIFQTQKSHDRHNSSLLSFLGGTLRSRVTEQASWADDSVSPTPGYSKMV